MPTTWTVFDWFPLVMLLMPFVIMACVVLFKTPPEKLNGSLEHTELDVARITKEKAYEQYNKIYGGK